MSSARRPPVHRLCPAALCVIRRAFMGALVAALAVVTMSTGHSAASWSSSGAGIVTTASHVLPAGSTPGVFAFGRFALISWAATTLPDGTRATGSFVYRTNTLDGSSVQVCATTINACFDTAIPDGTWHYTVQARLGTWVGPAGAPSAPIVVGGPAAAAVPDATTLVLVDPVPDLLDPVGPTGPTDPTVTPAPAPAAPEPEPTVADPVVVDPPVMDPVVVDPAVVDPVVVDPVVVDPPVVDPVVVDPPVVDPPVVDPVVVDPTVVEPAVVDPAVVDPSVVDPVVVEPADVAADVSAGVPADGPAGVSAGELSSGGG